MQQPIRWEIKPRTWKNYNPQCLFPWQFVVFWLALPHHIPGIRLLSNLITIRDIEFRMLVCYANNHNDNDNDNIYTTKKWRNKGNTLVLKQIYCELPLLSDQVWVQTMTAVKIVLLMDHSLVKGTTLDEIFLIIPVHFHSLYILYGKLKSKFINCFSLQK